MQTELQALAEWLGLDGVIHDSVGVVRGSLGVASTFGDAYRFVSCARDFGHRWSLVTVVGQIQTGPRLLGVYAHPDDESFCTGGTFARYAAAGCEIKVVTATRGQAGQIRSANLATRTTLAEIREAELRSACACLSVTNVECWDFVDGLLSDVDAVELEDRITRVLRAYQPDVVFTFGDDGAYGHPDHIAISRATTSACLRAGDPLYFIEHLEAGLQPYAPRRLYHACFPRRRQLLQDLLVRWLVEEGPDFKGDPEFVHGLLLLAQEASSLHCVDDHHEIKWFPAGFSIVEQGEPATALFFLLSGHADVVREDAQGMRRLVIRLAPGQFFGEQGIASGLPRNAHVVAAESATCLVFTPNQPTLFEGRGEGAHLISAATRALTDGNFEGATTRIDAGAFLRPKLQALAAYRSQFPIRPDMLPEDVFRELFGTEYFVQVFPPRELETSIEMLARHDARAVSIRE